MNRPNSCGKKYGASAVLTFALSLIVSVSFLAADLFAQKIQKVARPFNAFGSFSTSNQWIWGNVDGSSGRVNVLLPPGRQIDPALDFPDHSFFTCSINGTYFTNNDIIVLPANAKLLNDGNTVKIVDTIRTTWLNKNGVDIIQDIYPVAFTKSGQIVYKWSFKNNNGNPAVVACQFLQDIQITDPHDPSSIKSNDGPTILTKWAYKPHWLQYPNNTNGQSVPPFYIGFLHDLPNMPSYFPNLSGQGYLDYPLPPLTLVKPSRVTIGDWGTMVGSIFGTSPTWPAVNSGVAYGSSTQSDDALLLEFQQQGIPAGKTIVVGKTSYGQGEFESCIGQLFSLVFYPHHLAWTKTGPSGFYTPNPIHIEKFIVNGPGNLPASNTKITLRVGKDLTLVDTFCSKPIGKSQTQPTGTGAFLNPGDVQYFDWWACASPALFCTGTVTDTLVFTGTSGLGPPTFINPPNGADECDQYITLDCAEADLDAPIVSDTVYSCESGDIKFSDSRSTDRGLQSATWIAEPGTNAANFVISGPNPPIAACYNDKATHTITVSKVPSDSTASGCFDFTITDCLGHQSYKTLCLPGCIVHPHPDSLAPVFKLLVKSGTTDSTFTCDNGLGDNNRLDSFQVSDNNRNDSGICLFDTIPGSVKNYSFVTPSFKASDPIVRFSVHVIDSMKDGNICIRATDCSKEVHYSDTCIHYCPIKDVTPPRISISKDPIYAGRWNVSVLEDLPWDRGIDSIYIFTTTGNITPTSIPRTNYVVGTLSYPFTISAIDTLKLSDFCIEATDTAGNRSKANTACGSQSIENDTLCPNIIITPPLATNPTVITVNINDIHSFNGVPYAWDKGIDKIFFTNKHGMQISVPDPIIGNGASSIPPFQISVIDTTQLDTVACITINASDISGNTCSETFCYPWTADTLRPIIKLWYDPANRSQILGEVTDNTSADRGIDSIGLFHSNPGFDTNLVWNNIKLLGTKDYPITAANAITRDPSKSSTGAMWAIDRWGAYYSPIAVAHSANVNFAIWVQDFKMKSGIQPRQNTSFHIPVYFVKNDSIPVSEKNITDIRLGFTLKGDVNYIVFDGVSTAKTELANWSIPTPSSSTDASGMHIVVNATKGASGSTLKCDTLQVLPMNATGDSLLLLNFHALASDSNRRVTVEIDSMIFNNGRDSLYTGTSSPQGISTALMPAPYGNISGGVVVITGACSPQLTTNVRPSSVSLDPPHPNPFTHSTTFEYTVAEDGPVRFGVYDMLGQEIKLIVNDYQVQGRYTVTFDGSSLGSGNYIARLWTGGTVCSRRIGVEK